MRDVTPIRCLACYDYGEVIDRFDHSKRRSCECQRGQPLKGVTVDDLLQSGRNASMRHFYST